MGPRGLPYILVVLGTLAMNGASGAQDASRSPFQKSEPQGSGAALKPGANSFNESQVKHLLQSKGYSDVSALAIDTSGVWRGNALKDDKRVGVSVDFQGHIADK